MHMLICQLLLGFSMLLQTMKKMMMETSKLKYYYTYEPLNSSFLHESLERAVVSSIEYNLVY